MNLSVPPFSTLLHFISPMIQNMDIVWTSLNSLDFLEKLHTYHSVSDYIDEERQEFFRSLRPFELLLLPTYDLMSLKLGIRLKIDSIRRHLLLPPPYTRFDTSGFFQVAGLSKDSI
jgi:hypothetical protein